MRAASFIPSLVIFFKAVNCKFCSTYNPCELTGKNFRKKHLIFASQNSRGEEKKRVVLRQMKIFSIVSESLSCCKYQ